jgi:hypothetical protein
MSVLKYEFCCLVTLFFYPEDGGDMFLWKFVPIHQATRRHIPDDPTLPVDSRANLRLHINSVGLLIIWLTGIDTLRLARLWGRGIPSVCSLAEESPACLSRSPASWFWFPKYATCTVTPRYNGQNLAVYNYGFLEMLGHWEGFVVRKLFKRIKKNPNIKIFIHIITFCVSMFTAWVVYVSYCVLQWIPLHSIIADIGDNGHSAPPQINLLQQGLTIP